MSKSRVAAILLVVLVVWPAQLALNRPWQFLVETGLLIFVVGAIALALTGTVKFRIPQGIILLTLLWLIASVASAVAVDSPRVLQVSGALLTVFYLVAFLSAKSRDQLSLIRSVVIGVVAGGLTLMMMSLLVQPFSLYRYQGVFNNPNNMGWFTAGLIHLVLGALYENRLEFTKYGRVVLVTVVCLAAIFLLASNSRAALGSVIVVGGILGLLLWNETIDLRRGSVWRRGVRRLGMGLLISLGAVVAAWKAGLFYEIIAKFLETQYRDDVTQGRWGAWVVSLEHWNWLGYGPNYLVEIGRSGEMSGHSTWISHLSRYGLINTSLFMGFLISAAFWAWRAARLRSHPVAVVLLAVVIGFAANATFETGTSTPGMWLTVILFAIGLQRVRDGRP